jgi:hypothetical protein
MQLCEVIYNSIVQGRQRLQESLSRSSSTASSTPSSSSAEKLAQSTQSAPSPQITIHRVESRHRSAPALSDDESVDYGDAKDSDSRRRHHARSSSGIVFDGPRQRPSTTAVPKLRTSSKGYTSSLQDENSVVSAKDELLKRAQVQILLLWADSMVRIRKCGAALYRTDPPLDIDSICCCEEERLVV